MDKPITVQIEETRQTIIDTINNSKLHPFILDTILKDIYNEVHLLLLSQTEQDRKEYAKSQKNVESSS